MTAPNQTTPKPLAEELKRIAEEKGGERKMSLTLPKVGDYSIYPKWSCPTCGEKLWSEISRRTGWKEWAVTKDGRHHLKTRCNLGCPPTN